MLQFLAYPRSAAKRTMKTSTLQLPLKYQQSQLKRYVEFMFRPIYELLSLYFNVYENVNSYLRS